MTIIHYAMWSFEWVQGSLEWISFYFAFACWFPSSFECNSHHIRMNFPRNVYSCVDFLYHSNAIVIIFEWISDFYFLISSMHLNEFGIIQMAYSNVFDFLDSLPFIRIRLTLFEWVLNGLHIRMSARFIWMSYLGCFFFFSSWVTHLPLTILDHTLNALSWSLIHISHWIL